MNKPSFITLTSLWPRWPLKSPASWLFTQSFIQPQIKENIKDPRNWPLCGEFTGTVENVYIWWCHHVVQIMACRLDNASANLKQWCNILNWILRNKLQWNLDRNWNIFIKENTFENVIWEMLPISSRPQCVNHKLSTCRHGHDPGLDFGSHISTKQTLKRVKLQYYYILLYFHKLCYTWVKC